MSSVTLTGVIKRYGSFTAVNGIDLSIPDGEFLVLLGPSGCGKTTTLRCIAGLEDISGGEIRMGDTVVSGGSVATPPERRDIGMVFQSYAIWPHLSVRENVAFGLKIKGLGKTEIERRVNDVLGMVGLNGYADRGASQLSGGQQQRVALARAFVLEPRVLLFDEPLSNLDAKLRERMRFEIRQMQQRLKITSIYVTHDQQEAMVVADRIVLMNGGNIAHAGRPEEIYNRPRTRFGAEFVGLANFLPGTVAGVDGQRTTVKLENGQTVHVVGADWQVGEKVDAICRPEYLAIARERMPGDNVFPVQVNSTFFLGNTSDIYLQFDDIELRGQLSPPAHWVAGEPAFVRLPPEAIALVPKE